MGGKDDVLTIRIEKEWKDRIKRVAQELSKRQPDGKFTITSIAESAIKLRIIQLEKELFSFKGDDGDDEGNN